MNGREGRITRSLGGFYTVTFPDGDAWECRGRGLFRKEGIVLLAGDRCRAEATEPGKGIITGLLPRGNRLVRPPVANLDRLALVVSLSSPAPNPLVLDQLTAIAAHQAIPAVFIFTKSDLRPAEPWVSVYRRSGYPAAVVNNLTGEGREEAAALVAGGVTVFCGNSGAGKTSLLNLLYPGLGLKTGEVSERLGRGRHTTRHVELFPVGDGGYLADTPGFSALEFAEVEPMTARELAGCFPEFRACLGRCRFSGCSHRTEPGCAVLEAVADGRIAESRHRSYRILYGRLSGVRGRTRGFRSVIRRRPDGTVIHNL